jgi:diguanylate cyclase (GGDEF)-like protein/PAS domain S-box-containing protein
MERIFDDVVYRSIVEKSVDAVVIINRSGDIISWNSSAERIFGYMAYEVVGKYMHDVLLTHDLRETVNASFCEFKINNAEPIAGKEIQVQAFKKNGDVVHVKFNVNTIEINGELFAFAFLRDITDLIVLQEKLKHQATTDELTSILNRRAFLQQAKTAFSMSVRHREPFALLMLDIDHFKQVNDRYGHHAGDVALIKFVENVSDIIRSEDVFGRVGGEEFYLAIVKAEENVYLDLAERIRKETEKLTIYTSGTSFKLTVSIGASTLGKYDESLQAMQYRCDEALYKAKQSGRNRVVLNDPDM